MLGRVLGWSEKEAMKLCDEAVKAVRNPKTHAYTYQLVGVPGGSLDDTDNMIVCSYVAYAIKPEDDQYTGRQ